MRKSTYAVIGLALFSFILSIYFYPQMPEQMATHWNSQGEVNGYVSKLWGLFLMPLVITGIAVMFLIIPKIDPLKENMRKFRNYYDKFIIFLTLFLVSAHLYALLWNAGTQIRSNVVFPIGLGLLFYYVGILMENAERNWFIGIKTPWTLSSDKVWKKTNKLGGKLFKIAGIIAIAGSFFPEYTIFFVIVPVLSIAGFTVVYSYVEYQKELKAYPENR